MSVRWTAFVCGLALASSVWAQAGDADRVKALEHRLRDWGGLNRYGSDNTELRPPARGENRVVFFGDQVIEQWGRGSAKFFSGKQYLNRGIAGQTTAQMLVRFRQDVVSLQPKVVVIAGGMNDIAGAFGLATEEMVADNIMSMAELAKVHGIGVVLASVTPVCDCFTKPTVRQRWEEKIGEINELVKDFAARNGLVYLDFYAALSDGHGLKKDFTSDGLLPNDAAYEVMAPIAERAIAESLGKK